MKELQRAETQQRSIEHGREGSTKSIESERVDLLVSGSRGKLSNLMLVS